VPTDRRARRTALWGVIAAVFLVGTGVGSVLPILPLFLRERGSSFALVGVVVAASAIAALALGTVGTAETAAKAVGALLGGGLFGLGVAVPFVVSAVVGVGFILVSLPWLRAAGRDAGLRPALAVTGNG
jgi:hypothetical protein